MFPLLLAFAGRYAGAIFARAFVQGAAKGAVSGSARGATGAKGMGSMTKAIPHNMKGIPGMKGKPTKALKGNTKGANGSKGSNLKKELKGELKDQGIDQVTQSYSQHNPNAEDQTRKHQINKDFILDYLKHGYTQDIISYRAKTVGGKKKHHKQKQKKVKKSNK